MSSTDWNSLDTEDFRATVRRFFEHNYPEALRYPKRRLRWAEIRDWTLKLSAQGWLAPSWPVRYGGMGLAPEKLIAFIEEQERHGVARAPDMGISMVGPLLIQHGSDEQRAHYLPRILSCEDIWCQGYSEPNSGSDLASLRTEAVEDGDDFIVNGQKTWTTLAQDATHIFLLVRTDKAAKKQEGISFLLADMKSPGITVRPIRNIAGAEDFCEVFLDKVRVPRANIVGELNKGWTIAKALLGFERIFLGSPKLPEYGLLVLESLARARGLLDDPVFNDRFMSLKLDVHVAPESKGEAGAYQEADKKPFWAQVTSGQVAFPDVDVAGALGHTLFQDRCTFVDHREDALFQNLLARHLPWGDARSRRELLHDGFDFRRRTADAIFVDVDIGAGIAQALKLGTYARTGIERLGSLASRKDSDRHDGRRADGE